MEIENTTKATLTNVAGQAVHELNNTAKATVLPIAAAFGFMPGHMLGLRKG